MKCVGAFRLVECDNETDVILCDVCHAKVERVMDDLQAGPKSRAKAKTRHVYRRRHAKTVAA